MPRPGRGVKVGGRTGSRHADRGGHTDLIRTGETGLLAATGDPEAFGEAALELLDDEEERIRPARRARRAAAGTVSRRLGTP